MVGDTSYDLEMAQDIAMPRVGGELWCARLKRWPNLIQ